MGWVRGEAGEEEEEEEEEEDRDKKTASALFLCLFHLPVSNR